MEEGERARSQTRCLRNIGFSYFMLPHKFISFLGECSQRLSFNIELISQVEVVPNLVFCKASLTEMMTREMYGCTHGSLGTVYTNLTTQ